MAEIEPRIIGSEMEWPMSVRLAETTQYSQLTDTKGMQFRLPDELKIIPGWHMMSNGARYYPDVGDRLEYATPETTSFEDVAIREFAGERIVMNSLLDYAKENDKVRSVILTKRVLDSFQNGWGYHINLSADKTKIHSVNDDTSHLLALHLATSSPMLGGGAVYEEGDKLKYSYGQKALSLNIDYDSTTTSMKPLVNQRQESLAEGTNLRRIHITSLDPHISPWSTKMAFGTSSLILRAIEQGRGQGIRLSSGLGRNALKSLARRVATDIDMVSTTRMSTGRTISALGIQEKLLSVVSETYRTDEEEIVLQEWKQAFEILQSDKTTLVHSDAIAKLGLMRAWMKRNDTDSFDHRAIQGMDNMYTRLMYFDKDISEHQNKSAVELHALSLPGKLRAGKFADSMPLEKDIIDAITNPPITTRAYQRGNAISTGDVSVANWNSYTENGKSITINDPRIPKKYTN